MGQLTVSIAITTAAGPVSSPPSTSAVTVSGLWIPVDVCVARAPHGPIGIPAVTRCGARATPASRVPVRVRRVMTALPDSREALVLP